MSDHRAFERLAATAVDFELEPADRTALAQHLKVCVECRRTAALLGADAARLRSLPRRAPSPHIAAAVARAARGEARARRSPILLLGLGFLLAAGVAGAVIGGAILRETLLSGDPVVSPSVAPTDAAIVLPSPAPPSPAPQTPAPQTPAPPTAAPTEVPDPRLGVQWQVITLPSDVSSRTPANAVTAGGPGFVTVGRTCQSVQRGVDCWGGVRLSSDGLTWEVVPRQPGLEIGFYYPTSGPGADMIGVAAGSGAIVAIGYAVDGARTIDQGGVFRPAVWVSRDGRTWERAPTTGVFDRARFSDVVATDSGYVIVGAVYGTQAPRGQPRGAIWTSDDGRAWRRVPDGPIFDIGGYQDTGEDPGSGGPKTVTVAGGQIRAVGQVCNDAGLDCVTAFWSSPDGSTWDRVVLSEPNVVAHDLVAWAGALVAVGIASNTGGCGLGLRCTAAVYTSADGRAWQREQIRVPEGMVAPDAFSDAVVVGGRIIAIALELEPDGRPQSPAHNSVWWSSDGKTWAPVQGIPTDFSPAFWQPIAAGQARAVIVDDMGGLPWRILVSPPR